MNNIINLSKERKRREKKKKIELDLEIRKQFRNSIWADLVKKFGTIAPEMREATEKAVRAEEIKAFGEPPK